MKVKRRVCHTIEFEGLELGLTHGPHDAKDPVIKKLADRILVGYLVQDEDCASPVQTKEGQEREHNYEPDGMGHIRSFSSRHSNNMPVEDGQAIIESDKDAVLLSYFEHGLCRWGVAGTMSNMPDFRWDGTRFAGVWWPDDSCREHIISSAIAKLLPQSVKVEYKSKLNPDGTCITRPPKKGEKPYFADGTCIDERFSNMIMLTMLDGKDYGPFKSFESAYRSAARRLDIKVTAAAIVRGRRLAAEECAAQACDEYTKWCNGECYGVVVDIFDPQGNHIDHDSCWGMIGADYAGGDALEEHMGYAEERKIESQNESRDLVEAGAGI